MRSHTVTEKSTLLPYLLKVFPHVARTKMKQLLTHGLIIVNDQSVTRHNFPLNEGDEIQMDRRTPESRAASKVRLNFPIVYEDDAIVVVDKPAGLLTMGTDHIKVHTVYYKLNEYLKAASSSKKGRALIVHRLDRDASGLLVFAKTEKAKNFLQENWQDFEKKYYALVEGTPKKISGTIESYLVEDKFKRVYSTHKGSKAKFSVTHYRVLESLGPMTLLEVQLETGRKNQIRVHLADLGHPIVGDDKYGSKMNPIRRLGLHAHSLSFEHPVTGETKTFSSPLPPNFPRKK